MNAKKSDWKKNLNIPNALSVLRLLLIVPFVLFFLNKRFVLAALMLLLSGLSDMLDGVIARRFNQFTPLGAMLDPVADKLTLGAVVVCMSVEFPVIIPLVVVLLMKEFLMLAASLVMLKKHVRPPKARWYGKIGTAFLYISVFVIVALKAIWNIENDALTLTLICITTALMLFAFGNYCVLFFRMLKDSKQQKLQESSPLFEEEGTSPSSQESQEK